MSEKNIPQIAVVVHRGGACLNPENTLTAFRHAVALGVTAVECDVHLSKDGRLVVMHDATVTRTTDGEGEVREKTFAELQQLNAAAHFGDGNLTERIPSLEDVLDVVKGKALVQIELKGSNTTYPGIEEKVLDAIAAKGMIQEVIIICFDPLVIARMKEREGRLKTGVLALGVPEGNTPKQFVNAIHAQTHADYLLVYHGIVTPELVDAVHRCGMRIGAWTVNEVPEMQRVIGLGVDAITTDRPDVLLGVVGNNTSSK